MVIGFKFVIVLLLLLVVGSFVRSGIKTISPYEQAVYLRFGKFIRVLCPGTNLVVPWINRIVKFDQRIQSLEVPRQEIILKDNRSVNVNAVVFVRIIDTRSAFMEVSNYRLETINAAKTAICTALGHMFLDEILSTRKEINNRLTAILNESTEKWGVRVEKAAIREVCFSLKVSEPKDD